MRLWEQIRAVVLCGLGGLGLGLLMCRLLGYAPEGCLLAMLSGAGSGLLGALLPERKWKAAAVMAIGVTGSALLGIFWFRHFLPTLTLIAVSLLAFAAIVAGGCGFCGYLGCWSVVLLTGAALFSGRFGALWQTAASLCAVLALLLTLDGFRDNSLRRGQHLNRDTPLGSSYGLRRNSLLLYGLFLVGAVAASAACMGLWSLISGAVKALLHLLLTGTGKLGYGVTWLILQFMNFLKWLLSLLPDLPEDRSHSGGASDYEPPVYTGGPGSLLTTALFVLLVAVGVALLAGAAGTVMLRSRRRKARNVQEPDYVDEVESLRRPKLRLFDWLKHRTGRKAGYQGAMKIRFAFQQLLRRRKESDPTAYAKTPNELRQQPQEDALIDAYNRVRYAQGDVTEADIAAAERVLKAK